MHVFFIVNDPAELEDSENRSVHYLAQAYLARGDTISAHRPENVMVLDADLYLSGRQVTQDDLVWFRIDPQNTTSYYELLRRLCQVKARIVNPPSAMLTMHDKLTISRYNDQNFPIYSVSCFEDAIYAFDVIQNKGYASVIVKTPSRFGGQGLIKVSSHEQLQTAFNDLYSDSGYVVIQGYVNSDASIVTRVAITADQIILKYQKQYQQSQGSQFVDYQVLYDFELSEGQIKKIQNVQKDMAGQTFFIGIDFVLDHIIEINYVTPAGLSLKYFDHQICQHNSRTLIENCDLFCLQYYG